MKTTLITMSPAIFPTPLMINPDTQMNVTMELNDVNLNPDTQMNMKRVPHDMNLNLNAQMNMKTGLNILLRTHLTMRSKTD